MAEVDFADFDAESAVMEVEQTQSQLGYEFEIRQPYTIPSDGKSVAAEIGRFDLPAAYIYQSTPKIDKDAFLVAEATGWERLNLLQGEANVYFENTFVGKSILDPGQTSDTLRFSMGRDRSIRIERTKENDYSSRRAIGSNQTQTVAWKFSVRNTRPEPVVLTLADQLPVSRNSAIAVSAEELSGGQLDKESGIVTWRLELKPGEQRELRLRYAREISQRTQPDNRVTRRGEGNGKREDCIVLPFFEAVTSAYLDALVVLTGAGCRHGSCRPC